MSSLLVRLRSTVHALLHRRELETGMADEIAFHLEQRTADLVASGLRPGDAARQARLEFGTAETHRDAIRSALGTRWLDELLQDLRYAVRILRKSPGFTLIAVSSLALAIGANTTVFSLAHQYLYAKLHVPRPSELRVLSRVDVGRSPIHDAWGNGYMDDQALYHSFDFTWPVYQSLRQNAPESMRLFAAKDLGNVNVTAGGEARSASASLVDGNFYGALEVKPILGRPILPSDDTASANNAVAVLSYGFWKRALGGSAAVIGQTIRVNNALVTVVGVNPPDFTGAADVMRSPDLFLPLAYIRTIKPNLGRHSLPQAPGLAWVELLARTRPGTDTTSAQAALTQVSSAALRNSIPVKAGEQPGSVLLEDASRGTPFRSLEMRKPVYVLLAFAGLVLLLACANVANLMLARAANRGREMGVRLALGAGRTRIFRQLLTEGLVLAALAGALGLFLGYLARNLIPRLLQSPWQRDDLDVSFGLPIVLFALGLSVFTALLFGLAPALQASRHSLSTTLKQNQQSASRGRRHLGSKAIVALQVALSTLLITGCVLFVRTVLNLNAIHTGFDTHNLLLFQINPPDARYAGKKSVIFHQQLQQRIAAIPGVQSVAVTDIPFLAHYSSGTGVTVEGRPKDNRNDDSNTATVASTFFATMRIPLLTGRNFVEKDDASSPDVAIVNEAFARHFFPGTNPVGKRFSTQDDAANQHVWTEVVGICADTLYSEPRHSFEPIYFTPYTQFSNDAKNALGMTYIVRTPLPPEGLTPSLRRAVQGLDPDLPLLDIRTQLQQMEASTSQERTFASLTAGFGVLALALAAVGIYGVMAYTVAQRTNEIGIRLALGAARHRIQQMILRETGTLALIGIVAGLLAALGLVRLIKSMLFGIRPTDPVSLLASAALLLALAFVSGWIPAARAARVEPMEALRHD